MTEVDKRLIELLSIVAGEVDRALMQSLYERLKDYKGLPITPDLRKKISLEVRKMVNDYIINSPLPSTVSVEHVPMEEDPRRLEINMAFLVPDEDGLWDTAFSSNPDALARLGESAMDEYRLGLTEILDPEIL